MLVRVSVILLGTLALLAGCTHSEGGSTASTPAGGDAVQLEHLTFVLPSGWKQVPPSSGMRVAQAVVTGPGGPAEMAVFNFGVGQGGNIEANIQRWVGQVELAPGTTPQREQFDANGLRVAMVDVKGTLKAGQMGMGPAQAQPDSRLLGAVVEGVGGPWFFKITGPDATLGPQRDAFVAMLHSMQAH
jgi:hypothetical protein